MNFKYTKHNYITYIEIQRERESEREIKREREREPTFVTLLAGVTEYESQSEIIALCLTCFFVKCFHKEKKKSFSAMVF